VDVPGDRLSLTDCRRQLGAAAAPLSDDAVLRLRDQLYAVADVVVSGYESEKGTVKQLQELPEGDRHTVEERAAILEFDGRLSRGVAVRRALESHEKSLGRH
jgi:hypothetical protein